MHLLRAVPREAMRRPVRDEMGQGLLIDSWAAVSKALKALAALPFDALRVNYANAVNAGLVTNSMLASRDFEHVVGALERAALGPLARCV